METEITLKFSKNPQALPLSKNRKYGLLIGLMGGEEEHFYTDSLTTGVSKQKLSQHPLIKLKTINLHLKQMLNFLKEEGERSAYDIIIPYFLSESEDENRNEKIEKKYLGIARFKEYSRNLSTFLSFTKQQPTIHITHEDLQKGILAWDLDRIVIITRMAYDLEIINEKEAWEYIEYTYKISLRYFIDWSEVGKSFLLGQIIHEYSEKDFNQAIEHWLLVTSSPDSPWQQCPFE